MAQISFNFNGVFLVNQFPLAPGGSESRRLRVRFHRSFFEIGPHSGVLML